MLDGFGEFRNGLIGISVFDAVTHTVVQMSLQYDLPDFVQSTFGGIDLDQDILTGNILVHHFINGLELTDDFFQPAV